jgi:hypothetical protein
MSLNKTLAAAVLWVVLCRWVRRCWVEVVGVSVAAFSIAASVQVWGQTLVAVEPESSSVGFLILALVVAVGGGLIYLKLKMPNTYNVIAGRAKEVQHTIGVVLDGVETKLHAIEAQAPVSAPAVAPAPTSLSIPQIVPTGGNMELKFTEEEMGALAARVFLLIKQHEELEVQTKTPPATERPPSVVSVAPPIIQAAPIPVEPQDVGGWDGVPGHTGDPWVAGFEAGRRSAVGQAIVRRPTPEELEASYAAARLAAVDAALNG